MPDPSAAAEPLKSRRTTVRRKAERGRYDFATVAAILDAGLVAHVGFDIDDGVCVLPMAYARDGGQLYLHGAAGNDMLRRLSDGVDVCVTVTIVDGLVLSRSAFHHSLNYRSVVVVGRAVAVENATEKAAAVRAIVDHVLPGRSEECRGPTDAELRATRVIRLPIDEASAKIRSGPPIEEPDDLSLPYWGGVIPMQAVLGPPVADEFVRPGTQLPGHVR